VPDQLGVDGNIEADPQYCGALGRANYFLQSDSPCAPALSGCGERMSAWDVGCETTAMEPTNWGAIKGRY